MNTLLTYTSNFRICILLFIIIFFFSLDADARKKKACKNPEDCAAMCQAKQDDLNRLSGPTQVWQCTVTQMNTTQTPGGSTHTDVTCNCVSFVILKEKEGGGDPSGLPGGERVPLPPGIDTPPGGSPGSPYGLCMQRAMQDRQKRINDCNRTNYDDEWEGSDDEKQNEIQFASRTLCINLAKSQYVQDSLACSNKYQFPQDTGLIIEWIGKNR